MTRTDSPPVDAWFPDAKVLVEPLHGGYINQTYLVRELSGPNGLSGVTNVKAEATVQGDYVLQGINNAVFTQPECVLRNQQRLLDGAQGQPWFDYQLPGLLPTRDGSSWLARDGVWWRLSPRIKSGYYDPLNVTKNQAEAAGRAFADFHQLLAEIGPGTHFEEVLPGFHQLAGYLGEFKAALALMAAGEGPTQHDDGIADLVTELEGRSANYLTATHTKPALIHGDCKSNNLLFDTQGIAVVAILDLDTTMRGQWWWDFGDLVRSVAQTPVGEFRQDLFDAVVEGFFARRTKRSECRIDQALIAPGYMAYMLCVRFLTDHLNGDRYFLVRERGDNLDRAQRQLQLLNAIEQPSNQRFMRASLARFCN